MKTLDNTELSTVAGGAAATKNDQITSTLTQVQSSIKDLASQKSNSSNDMLLPIAMMMMARPAPTVVAAGAAPVAAGPVINVSSRIGRRW